MATIQSENAQTGSDITQLPYWMQSKLATPDFILTGKRSSGLGLCFAREVAHLHHGTVTLRNRSDASGAEAILALAAIPERSL
jgi:nitrogen-specific signal transduction histidine kinase